MKEKTSTLKLGHEINRGKTKKIIAIENDDVHVVIESMDDITAGDGAKRDSIVGKAEAANETTCNVFNLLKSHWIPVSFIGQMGPRQFLSENCIMIPLEVVVRRVALGSYLKRNPGVKEGHVFDDLVVELYLKTNDRTFRGISLPCDDPYLKKVEGEDKFEIYHPSKEIIPDNLITVIPTDIVMDNFDSYDSSIRDMAMRAFSLIRRAWSELGYTLIDFKIELGFNFFGVLLISDVIDNDSWRVLDTHGKHVDKQLYRDGKDLKSVKGKYEEVARLTRNFVK